MPTRISSAIDAYRQNEGDILGNGKDDTTSENAGRTPVLDPEAGLSTTTVAIDGDLRTIDTAAEAIALDPAANTTGAASAKYSRAFLLRWIIKILQPIATAVDGLEAQIGATSETAPADDTATAGLNGRLQRIAQRITSLGKAVDDVGGGTDTGVVALALRRDSLATLTPADGDYTRLLVNSRGALHVSEASQALTALTGTTSTSGDNTLISAPGSGQRIVISSLVIQNESSTATTYIWKSGSTNIGRIRAQSQGDGIALTFPSGRGLRLGTNEAFGLNLSGANATGYTVYYFTEAS